MSQENVELVLAMAEAWNAGNMNALRELLHRDVILRPPEGWPEPGPYVGRDAAMRQFDQLRRTWDVDTVDPVSEFVPTGDRVVVRVAWRGVGSGPDAEIEFTQVHTFRDGKLIGLEHFWDHDRALEATGLR